VGLSGDALPRLLFMKTYRKKCCALKTVEIVETMNHPSPGNIRNDMDNSLLSSIEIAFLRE
jgi:predicted transcriptional regulator